VLDWANGRVSAIRDYRFAPYVMESLPLSPL
jgi:hypothetical protein